MPKTEVMEEKAGTVMKEFNDMIFPVGYDGNIGKRKVCIVHGYLL